MPTIVDTEVSKPARITGRVMSGVVILFLLFDGAIKLVPLPVLKVKGLHPVGQLHAERGARSSERRAPAGLAAAGAAQAAARPC